MCVAGVVGSAGVSAVAVAGVGADVVVLLVGSSRPAGAGIGASVPPKIETTESKLLNFISLFLIKNLNHFTFPYFLLMQ